MTFKYILNPINGKYVSIYSIEGKRVLGNYLFHLKKMGGSLRKHRRKHRRRYKKCRSCGRKYLRKKQRYDQQEYKNKYTWKMKRYLIIFFN